MQNYYITLQPTSSNFQDVKIMGYHLFFSIIINRKYITEFQQICFLILGVGCGMAWTFERHANRELRGFTNALHVTGSKTECEDRCLDERSFTCR